MFSISHVQDATRRAMATGALQPIETQTTVLDDAGVRFVVRAVSSLARKDEAYEMSASERTSIRS